MATNFNNNLNILRQKSPEAASAVGRGTMSTGSTATQLPRGSNLMGAYSSAPTIGNDALSIPQTGSYYGANNTTPQMITSYQQGGATQPLAYDTAGSKLVEALQGARGTQMKDVSNRLSALGYTGGQAGSMLSDVDKAFGANISSALGNFNLDRLRDAANVSRDFLQLELARQLGMGNLALGENRLGLERELGLGNLGLARELGTGNLALGYGNLGLGYNQLGYQQNQLAFNQTALDREVALRLAEMAQSGDISQQKLIADLLNQYFGGNTNG